MSIKKDQLKQAFSEMSKPTPKPAPIQPLSLDPSKRGEQANSRTVEQVATTSDNKATEQDIKPPKKRVVATLPKPKWGVTNTSRYSFEITDELKAKLNKRVAEITLATGKKTTASEIIRQALARELREL